MRSALRSLQGEFSKKIHLLVDAVIRLRTYVEAAIDFVEEEIDFLLNQEVSRNLTCIIDDLETILHSANQGSLLRDGIKAVIAGVPNVGKSSLLNQLSGKDVAIVTDIPGTTRDLLRESILIDGLPIHIIDTAGLRESSDAIEQEGMRVLAEMAEADLILLLEDARFPSNTSNVLLSIPTCNLLTIRNKVDLTGEEPTITQHGTNTIISLSAKRGSGIDLLKNQIKSSVGFQVTGEGVCSARKRHLEALTCAHAHLQNGQQQLQNKVPASELLAEDLRLAQHALNSITGEFTSDDLLGKIFGNFCIGK